MEAGFTTEEAVRVSSYNGALFLNQAESFGTVAKRKQADLVVVRGNPVTNIRNIRNTEVVFKDGVTIPTKFSRRYGKESIASVGIGSQRQEPIGNKTKDE